MKYLFASLEYSLNFLFGMIKLYIPLLEFLYQNFSFPILILLLSFIFRNELSGILSTHKIDKITLNSIELSQKIKEETINKEKIIFKEHKSIIGNTVKSVEDIYKKNLEVIEKNTNIVEVNDSETLSSMGYIERAEKIVSNKNFLLNELSFGPNIDRVIALYSAFLYFREKDLIDTKGGAIYEFTPRIKEIEEDSFKIVTELYNMALESKREWSKSEILQYQKLIQIVITPYLYTQQNKE